MVNQNVAKGLFLSAIALFFGIQALGYPRGTVSAPGSGFFPVFVSLILAAIAILILVRSAFTAPVPLDFRFRNIGFVLAGLIAFALLSTYLNMTAGVIALVFIASKASDEFSFMRSLKITIFLLLIAYGLQKGLGLQLKLI